MRTLRMQFGIELSKYIVGNLNIESDGDRADKAEVQISFFEKVSEAIVTVDELTDRGLHHLDSFYPEWNNVSVVSPKQYIRANCSSEYVLNKLQREDTCLYVGAGVSKEAGIWDYNELYLKMMLDSPVALIRDLKINGSNRLIYVYNQFVRSLNYSQHTIFHSELANMQKRDNFTICTENRDLLLQKAGARVIERDKIASLDVGKFNRLIVIGISRDHQGFISKCRRAGKDIIVVNPVMPGYLERLDAYLTFKFEELMRKRL